MPCNTLFVRFAAFWLLLGYSCSTVLAASHARPTITLALLGALSSAVRGWISYDPQGEATMTHYTMERNFIAACGCTADSTHYPTAALSQMAYGSSDSYGPGCGRCFNVTLQNTYTPTPPFFPTEVKSLVIKVTDHCPLGGDWCNATEYAPNKGGRYLNFDLVYPSKAIPDDFFPSNKSFYGFEDFGVWNVSYQSVSCEYWAGWSNAAALGSVPSLASGGCCPANPTGSSNDTCPSFSDQNGLPPDTASTGFAHPLTASRLGAVAGIISLAAWLL